MLFNSAAYVFLFLPLVLLGYFFLNHRGRHREAKLWLVVASLFFYGYWNYRYIVLLIFSLLVNYRTAYQAEGNRKLLVFGVVFNLALLLYFKYCDFFIENVNQLTGASWNLVNVVLPLGISFITFQKIAYLVDSYKGKVKNKSFVDFCLFATFFPQLIAGPIVHHAEVIPQFNDPQRRYFSWNNAFIGLVIFLIGLFKKVVIADFFYWMVLAGYDIKDSYSFCAAWALSFFYTIQIYFDFSGYTDMAIGAALMMNIRLPLNFNSPLKSRNIVELWERWHMTLSRWLRDYIYIPLGGNRLGNVRSLLNVGVTFLIGGIWHGANWTFLIWGALHGACLILCRLWASSGGRLPAMVSHAMTFIFWNITLVISRSESMGKASEIFKGMINVFSIDQLKDLIIMIDSGIGSTWLSFLQGRQQAGVPVTILFAISLLVFCFCAKNTNEIMEDIARCDDVISKSIILRVAAMAVMAVFFMLYAYANPSPFIYFQF